jgi:hypothetical protein
MDHDPWIADGAVVRMLVADVTVALKRTPFLDGVWVRGDRQVLAVSSARLSAVY